MFVFTCGPGAGGAFSDRRMTSIVQSNWHQIVEELKKSEPSLMRAWLLDLDVPGLAHGTLTIAARNPAQFRHLEKSRGAIAQCSQLVLGRLVTVEVCLAANNGQPIVEAPESGLRGDFTMTRFVVGPENRLAHAAASGFAAASGGEMPLLLLHGPQGAGKTHLLQAICHTKRAVGGSACYATAARFIADCTESFESGFPAAFRRQYAEIDLLALDDLRDFEGKTRSQEDLFHVLNGLLSSGRQFVAAADRPPGNMPGLQPRLVSRLESGLVMAVDSPTPETKLGILHRKNRDESHEIPAAVLKRLSERCPASELDGVLSRIGALAGSTGGIVTADLVDDLFRGVAEPAIA